MSNHGLSNSSRRSSSKNSYDSTTSESFSNDNKGTFLNINLLFLFVFGLFLYMSIKTPMFPNLNQTKKALLDRLANVLSSDKKKLL
jgi:hypothetical protein